MAGGSGDHQTEVVCIEAKQVCDFCFQEHRIDRDFDVPGTVTGTPVIECEIDERNIMCREIERRDIDGHKKKDKENVLVCLAIDVPVIIRIGNEEITQRVVFLKQAVLCAPAGTDIECQVTGNCCCFFDRETRQISCVFNFCVVIQSKVTVRILVPTFGLCAPKECQTVVTGCPPGGVKPCAPCDC